MLKGSGVAIPSALTRYMVSKCLPMGQDLPTVKLTEVVDSGSVVPAVTEAFNHCGTPLRVHSCCVPPLLETVVFIVLSSPAF